MLLALSAALSVVPAQAYTMYPVGNAGLALEISATEHHPEEDEEGWDCTTMGNLQCGPQQG